RRAMIAAVAGVTEIGLQQDPKKTQQLRAEGLVVFPEDLGIKRTDATRELLAAKNIADLVTWSDGLYQPPAKFRSW
ncbi:malonate decarboxylase subunit alpha, partial [Acinetobacter soli]